MILGSTPSVTNFYVPSRSSSGPQPSYSSPHIFLGGMVILLLCHKSITPLPQLSWLMVLTCLLNLILSGIPPTIQSILPASLFVLHQWSPPSTLANWSQSYWDILAYNDPTGLRHGFCLGFNSAAVSLISTSQNMSFYYTWQVPRDLAAVIRGPGFPLPRDP